MITLIRKDTGEPLTAGNKTIRISRDLSKVELALPTKPRSWTEITVQPCPVTGGPDCNCNTPPVDPPHDHPPVDPVPTGDVAAFVAAYKALPDEHSHGTGTLATEHMDVLALVPKAPLDKIAIKSGNWSDATIWHPAGVPTENQKVAIPATIEVKYGQISETTIFSLRVDGTLSFVETTDSRLKANTIVVTPTGKLIVGTQTKPITSKVEILFAGGNIDTAYDPKLLSKGIISHGEVSIYGTAKTAFVKAENVGQGSTQVQLKIIPQGWSVGDDVVITGTNKKGWYWDNDVRAVIHHESEDEKVKITAINGNTITIDKPLAFAHNAPVGKNGYVANLSRNIIFRSLVKEPVTERAHTMFMHSNKVKVYFATFEDMGRTDKSQPATDVGKLASVTFASNVKGRYPVHLHKTGTLDQNNPALVVGCSVVNSPGWGFAHHSSHADFVANVSFNVFGAGFAAEDGDETGKWENNIAIKSRGYKHSSHAVKDADDYSRHDNGRTGEGFFFAGRLVKAIRNVAANTTHGFVWYHRSAPSDPYSAGMEHPEVAFGAEKIHLDDAPIQGFRENEAFGNHSGLIVIKANTNQGHDVRSIFRGFTAWEVSNGVDVAYTAHYTFLDLDLSGIRNRDTFDAPYGGIELGSNAFDIAFNRVKINGFNTGAILREDFTFPITDNDYERNFFDISFVNVGRPFEGSTTRYKLLRSDQITVGRLSYVDTTPSTIGLGSSLILSGNKTDSIGTRNRQVAGDVAELGWNEHIAFFICRFGYYLENGNITLLIPDFIADRLTGDLLPVTHKVVVTGSVQQLSDNPTVRANGGAKFLGNL